MKQTLSSIRHLPAIVLAAVLLVGCSSHRGLVFADREWHVSDHFGQIIDRDTTYRMTFGNVLIPDPLTVISSADSAARYPGMNKFLSEILRVSHLDSAEILFYAPHMQVMFVRPRGAMPHVRPSSVSSPMTDEKPYTMWVSRENEEEWIRTPTEMYTYTYFDPGKKRLIIVDHYDYGDSPMAQITIFQSKNRMTAKMNIDDCLRHAFFRTHDLSRLDRDIEFWSHQVDGHRRIAFANYKIGQEQAQRTFDASRTLAQADSAMAAGSPSYALSLYKKYLKYEADPERTALYNAACAASLSGEPDYGLNLLNSLASRDSTWYFKDPVDPDLDNLKTSKDWPAFERMIAGRRAGIEANYNIPLRRELTRIRRRDQDIRTRFLSAFKSPTRDSLLIRSLLEEMRETDAANLSAVDSILNRYGWPGRDIVGDECMAIWMVLQHADLNSQRRALPMLKDAASKGDLSPVNIAMLEDRILVNSGRNQLYGTQFYYSEDEKGAKVRMIFPIMDFGNVDERRLSVGLPPLGDEYTEEEIGRLKL